MELELREEFLREKRFLGNLSETSLKYYGYVFNRWEDYVGQEPDSDNIKDFVIKVRESGVSVFTANSYIRGMNSYLSWKGTDLRIGKLKEPEQILVLFTDKQIQILITYKGVNFADKRLHTLTCLLIDTGCRIEEILGLRRVDVDFENLLVKVTGKGSKDRLIPISRECRAILYRFLQSHKFEYVFPAHGGKWSYRSALEQFKRLCKKLGIEGPRCSFHTLRHYFACNWIRQGGDLYRLSKTLGHSDIQTTAIYLKHMGVEVIQDAARQFSPLSRR